MKRNEAGYNGICMKIQAVIHKAEEGGVWVEVPSIPGCTTEGEAMEELLDNLREAIEGCLAIPVTEPFSDPESKILEIAV